MKRILVVGAHVGDAELMAGGVILKHTKAGGEVFIVHMSKGERGHPSLPPAEYAKQKEREALESAKLMKAEVIFMPYEDALIPNNEEARFKLAEEIRKIRPSIVITHWVGSYHKDHENTSRVVKDAIFLAAMQDLPIGGEPYSVSKLYFAENWEDPIDFVPEVYVDISEVFEEYRKAIEVHEFASGKFWGFNYVDYYTSLARIRGIEVRTRYAQALMPDKSWASYRVKVDLL